MISRIAAVHSVAPIIFPRIYGPRTLNCQLVSGLLETSGMMPSAPGAVILNFPAHSNITIIPMLQTRKGIFRSATNAAILVRTLFACSSFPPHVSADVVSAIKRLLHAMSSSCRWPTSKGLDTSGLYLDFESGHSRYTRTALRFRWNYITVQEKPQLPAPGHVFPLPRSRLA